MAGINTPDISIHAPPRGATDHYYHHKNTYSFQFTPLREGRRARLCQSPASYQFQFTPLREGRLQRPAKVAFGAVISIHAPPRGATLKVSPPKRVNIFQFTPLREGRRKVFRITSDARDIFQFTPLREGRRGAPSCRNAGRYFNSRPSARGDGRGESRGRRPRISIHAPPRGATCSD